MSKATRFTGLAATLCALVLAACGDDPVAQVQSSPAVQSTANAPADLVTTNVAGDQFTLWPFTGTDVNGTASDPINLIFRGQADTRSIRAALMSLDGNRTAFGFPNVFPFNCTWSDAYGDPQTGYTNAAGWTGSVIQLQCGTYGPIRFHIRLFPSGAYTLANAHFEVVIPGTADHQVLNWELAEQLVTVDFVRTGLLGAAPAVAAHINPAPGYRTIPAVIYNGLPDELKAMVGGPASTTTSVPIANDGNATVLTLAGTVANAVGEAADAITIDYNQVIPRPFCSTGPADYVLVQGPVTLSKRVTQTAGGMLTEMLTASGKLNVTQINPLTGERGATSVAEISDIHEMTFGGYVQVNSSTSRKETRTDGTGTSLRTKLQLGARDSYSRDEKSN